MKTLMPSGWDGSTDGTPSVELAAVTQEVSVRVLNCSAAGCLLETTGELLAGTVAVLHVTFAGLVYADAVRVVRCQRIVGDAIYHVGAEFLCTVPPYAGTLRYLMHYRGEVLSGWLEPNEES